MRKIVAILLLASYSIPMIPNVSFGQGKSRTELESQKQQLLNQIAEAQKTLNETRKDKNASLVELNALEAKLQARQQLIGNINAQLTNIGGDITSTNNEIGVLNNNLDVYKDQYAASVRYAYKTKASQNMLAFLFSASSFNDAIRRMAYMKRYRDYRKVQSEKIKGVKLELNQKVGQLTKQKQTQQSLLSTQEQQKSEILKETAETNEVVQSLKGKESELLVQIKKDQKSARLIENTIKEQIRKEILAAKLKAQEEARKRAALLAQQKAKEKADRLAKLEAEKRAKLAADREKAANDLRDKQAKAQDLAAAKSQNNNPSSKSEPKSTGTKAQPKVYNSNDNSFSASKPLNESNSNTNTPEKETPNTPATSEAYKDNLSVEQQNISQGFANNKGRLPWPANGYISAPYGRYQHPLEKGVMLENNGIDITTSEGAPVYAVFSGEVSKVFYVPGRGTTLLINHGDYYTVYSGLAKINVSVGAKISGRQAIGSVGRNDDGNNILHFEVWHVSGSSNIGNVNPTSWLGAR